MHDKRYHQLSGEVGFLAPLLMIFLGVIAAVILSLIYNYLIYHLPFVYFNFLLTVSYGGLIGWLVGYLGQMGKLRNGKVYLLIGLLVGLFAEYVSLVSWIFVMSKHHNLIFSIFGIFNFAKEVAIFGSWSIFGFTFKGTLLYMVWLVEALIIVGLTSFVSVECSKLYPFCEKCKRWFKNKITISGLEIPNNVDNFKEALEGGHFSSLLNLGKSKSEADYLQIVLPHCPACGDKHYLSVDIFSNKKKSKEVIRHLIIDGSIFHRIQDLGKR